MATGKGLKLSMRSVPVPLELEADCPCCGLKLDVPRTHPKSKSENPRFPKLCTIYVCYDGYCPDCASHIMILSQFEEPA